ncbi:histidine phosphatase family protein [Corynebacterium breve]|uniref:Histidine phosphatase family protein n=1 Tax=Corynebacterium breve TaxID=3049799 RepID=A0ABY8VFI4_9CORY|nr:histidine phosphatase family protein [Corynebacterium breve]WIM67525.1 histidine phosphatase family protein [Corynebacterium breve]
MLVLLRHGQTHSNVKRALDTKLPGAALTELGQQQSRDVGPEIMDLYAPERIVTSEALRARQTGHHAFGSLFDDIPAIAGLHEIAAGVHEMATHDEALIEYHEVVHQFFTGDTNAMLTGGENLETFLDRYRTGVEPLLEHTSVVVSHGSAIRTFAARATNVDPKFAQRAILHNCRFVVLNPVGEFGQWELVRWGDEEL